MRPWFLLAASSVFQVGWLVSLRELSGLRRPVPLLLYAAFGIASTLLLSRSLEQIPLATAYAAWTALSVVGALLFEMGSGRQAGDPLRVALVLVIVAATAGLQLAGAANGSATARPRSGSADTVRTSR